jgi:hypothetical protein
MIPYGPPAPTAADLAYDATVNSGSTPNPLYNFSSGSPSSSSSPSALTAGIAAAGGALKSAFSPTTPQIIGGVGAPGGSATAAALTSYMPLIILGLGGIALIAVLKNR